jgi:peptide/nickel transport system ATP-binding protein
MAGETLAVVGESGSGKTTLGRAILQLVEPSEGSIAIAGIPVSAHAPDFKAMSRVVQVIFQDSYAALSPRRTVAATIAEPLLLNKLSSAAVGQKVLEMLHAVGLDEALADRHPHELSGGQRQRVSIARALIVEPRLVIADEPVSSLDVTVRAQILLLLQKLKATRGFACLFISHDLGVVEQIANRVAVMRNGRIVECRPTDELFRSPDHAYTRELLHALPRLTQVGVDSYVVGIHQFEKGLTQ